MKRIIILTLLFAASCTPKGGGFLTLVNSSIEQEKIGVDGRSFTIQPSHHITKEFTSGIHEIDINGENSLKVTVEKDKTTIFDSTGLSCFTVIDFAKRYSGGVPEVLEKSFRQQTYTTKNNMSVVLGSYLPKTLGPGEKAIRLHQIDCEIFEDDSAIINEVGGLL
jgi:hypothetical protein